MGICFLSNRAEICTVTHEIIIYRLVVRSHAFDAYLEEILFWRENGRGCQGVWDLKLVQSVDPLGQPLYRKRVFEISGPEPPLRGFIISQEEYCGQSLLFKMIL